MTYLLLDQPAVKSILDKTGRDSRFEPLELPTLTFESLKVRLDGTENKLVDQLLSLNPAELGFKGPFVSLIEAPGELAAISGQSFVRQGVIASLPTQYLPADAYEAFESMRAAIRAEIGKELMVESGYRSPAHQLVTFLTYLELANNDIYYVARGVALPGYSQHGDPHNTAVDVINQDGIPDDFQPALFAQTAEYDWLSNNASRFKYSLSYPENNPDNVKFEPWHWRYVG